MVSGYETFRHIFTVHAQKRLFRTFRSKIWLCRSLRRPRFPIRRVYFHYPMTFTAYIWCFFAQFYLTLLPWPSILSDELRAWHIKHTYKFLAPYDYPFLSYVWLNLITLPSPGTVTALTYHRGQKWSTFFKSLTPNLPIHFITFKELRRRLSYVICEK